MTLKTKQLIFGLALIAVAYAADKKLGLYLALIITVFLAINTFSAAG